MYGVGYPGVLVILSEAKNLVPRVLAWGSVKARGCAREEILRFAQNDMGSGFVTLSIMPGFTVVEESLVPRAQALTPHQLDGRPQAHQRPHAFEQEEAPLLLDQRDYGKYARTHQVQQHVSAVGRLHPAKLARHERRQNKQRANQ